MRSQFLEKFKENKLLVIARKVPYQQILRIAEAVYEGGVRFFEITFDQGRKDSIKETQRCISAVHDTFGEKMLIGAGTVLTVEQVRAAYESGAKFIVSPGISPKIIEKTLELGMVAIPGAMTPTEIMVAWSAGADIVKLFPADDLGYHYIRNILAPLCHIPLLATGGINPETISEFHAAGISYFGTGISIIKPELVYEKNYAEITNLAKLHIDAIGNLKEE
jgi:2-dehydro-3-deoxyphosphogluconate aldolase/(4S)-4-hydroxy-2-oxoglutarate aldolase